MVLCQWGKKTHHVYVRKILKISHSANVWEQSGFDIWHPIGPQSDWLARQVSSHLSEDDCPDRTGFFY